MATNLNTQELTANDLALAALERIDAHEKECGERWLEATLELSELRRQTDAHAARWDRVAWLLIVTILTSASAVIVTLV